METIVGNINITNSNEYNDDINSFEIMTFETFVSRNKDGEETFGLLVNFERNTNGKNGILISYNLMCAILVMISLVNFLIDPKDSNRAAVLVALILVLATIFNSSQVNIRINQYLILFVQDLMGTLFSLCKQAEAQGFNALTTYILVCIVFIAIAMLYYGLIIFKLQRFNKIEDEKKNSKENSAKVSNTILKWDRVMLVLYCIGFSFYNVTYFMNYYSK